MYAAKQSGDDRDPSQWALRLGGMRRRRLPSDGVEIELFPADKSKNPSISFGLL